LLTDNRDKPQSDCRIARTVEFYMTRLPPAL
jgi:hypothetical protein